MKNKLFLMIGSLSIILSLIVCVFINKTHFFDEVKAWGVSHQASGKNNYYVSFLFHDYDIIGLAKGTEIEQRILITPEMKKDETLRIGLLFGTSGKKLEGEFVVSFCQQNYTYDLKCDMADVEESIKFYVDCPLEELQEGYVTVTLHSEDGRDGNCLAAYYRKQIPKGDYRLGLNACRRKEAKLIFPDVCVNDEAKEGPLAMEYYSF